MGRFDGRPAIVTGAGGEIGRRIGARSLATALACARGTTASTAGLIGAPGLVAYIASKHAVIGIRRLPLGRYARPFPVPAPAAAATSVQSSASSR